MTENYKVSVIPEANKEMMLKECYRLDEMGCDEWLVHEDCEEIDEKLLKIDEWRRHISKCNNGYKNKRR